MTMLEDALQRFRERVTCPDCHGNGGYGNRRALGPTPGHGSRHVYFKCEACLGTGMVQHMFERTP